MIDIEIDVMNPASITQEQAISGDIIDALFEIEDDSERQQRYGAIYAYLKGKTASIFRANYTARKKELTAYRKRQEEEVRERRKAVLTSESGGVFRMKGEDGKEKVFNTGKWLVSQAGVVAQGFNGPIVACRYPIVIKSLMVEHESGIEKVTLEWWKDRDASGRPIPTTLTVDKARIANAAKIVDLANVRLPVTSESARNLVVYLDDFESLNQGKIPFYKSTCRFGWNESFTAFAPYTGDTLFNVPPSYQQMADSVSKHGNRSAWMSLVKEIRKSGRQEPLVYMAAAFGSVLVSIYKINSSIVNLYGPTGRGKTVALMLAASIWANPAERMFIMESNSTLNSMEQRLNVLNHLPLLVDDMSKMANFDRDKGTIIYNLCSNAGKGRLARDLSARPTAVWNNMILTNVERPLTDDEMNGGAINRVLDFEIQDGNIFADGNAIVSVLSGNYGFAGPEFIEKVINIGPEKIRAGIREQEERIKQWAKEKGEQYEEKQVQPLAVLLTADWLAGELIFEDGVRLDWKYCTETLKPIRATSENERAYLHVMDDVMMNGNAFQPNTNDEYKGRIWGKFETRDFEQFVAIIPSALDDMAKRHNFSAPQLIKWCARTGRLWHDKGKQTRKVVLPGFKQARVRCYVIRMDENEQDSQLEPAEQFEPDFGDIPFDTPGDISQYEPVFD